jgi:transcriptional regulator with XRE-family HTH domain
MINNKLIAARKSKKITQTRMAEMLSMSQSQYQRRECGKIHISDEEWTSISHILNKNVQDIKEDDFKDACIDYFSSISSSNNFFSHIQYFTNK